MQISKLGAFAALGAVLAAPALAQSDNPPMPPQAAMGGSYHQAMNTGPNGQSSINRPGMYSNGGGGNWSGSGYGPGTPGPQPGELGSSGFGPGGPAEHMGWSNREFVAHEVHAVRQHLEQAGFSNVRVVPESFLIQAQDREGRPVTMLISPHAVTEIMALNSGQNGPGGMEMGPGNMGPGGMSGSMGPNDRNDMTGNRE
jgi:hypothetical protein